MGKNKIIIFLSVAVLCGFLFFKGYKSNVATLQSDSQVTGTTKEFDFEAYIASVKNKLEAKYKDGLTAIGEDTNDTLVLQKKIVLWDSAGYPLVAAHYLFQLAKIKQDEKNWYAAGSKYYMLAASSSDSVIALESARQAKSAFEKVIEINKNNLDAKNALAACFIEVDQDVMKGVSLLKEVIEVDSNNVQAIYTLGMLSIQSNQLEKAQQRFEKLISLQPFNPEYYFYLGEIYAKSGNTGAAIKTYEKCKTLLTDKEAKKEVDTIINKLKNI